MKTPWYKRSYEKRWTVEYSWQYIDKRTWAFALFPVLYIMSKSQILIAWLFFSWRITGGKIADETAN